MFLDLLSNLQGSQTSFRFLILDLTLGQLISVNHIYLGIIILWFSKKNVFKK